MKQRFVCVYASNIAACIGANRYKPVHEAMEDMWKRLDPDGYRVAFSRNRVMSKERLLAKALRDNEEIAIAVAEAAIRENDSSAATESTAEKVKAMVDATKTMTPETSKLVKDHVQSRVFTKFGASRENNVFEKLADMGIDVRKHSAFFKKNMGTIGDESWFIGGKIDAITADRTMVVEIKNRVRRLFRMVPDYERVQLQSYMHLLDIEKSSLVECFTSLDDAMDINVMEVPRDREYWDTVVVPALTSFVTVLFGLLDDPVVQDAYVASEDRDHFIVSY